MPGYYLDFTINTQRGEIQRHRNETDAALAGIALTELLEKHPEATSFVVTVVPKSE